MRPITSGVVLVAWTLSIAASAAAQEPMPVSSQTGTGDGVSRSQFTSDVRQREPVDRILAMSNDESEVYYFTEIVGMGGQTVRHRWLYQGAVMAEVPFEIDGWRWRVWSKKTLLPGWTGAWRAVVVDEREDILGSDEFQYRPAWRLTPG